MHVAEKPIDELVEEVSTLVRKSDFTGVKSFILNLMLNKAPGPSQDG